MGERHSKKVQFEANSEKSHDPVPEEKVVTTAKFPPLIERAADQEEIGRSPGDSVNDNRDDALAKVEEEKKLALIKAWEENEKTKGDNKAYKKLSEIEAWENSKRAMIEAHLMQIEEKIEKQKAENGEKMKNKIAEIHREAEEKRAMVEAKRGELNLKIEEEAAKFRSNGLIPRKLFGCFSF